MLGVFKSKGFDCQAPGNNYHWSGSGFLYESRGRACYFPSPNGGYSCGHRQTNYRMMCWCGPEQTTTTTTTTADPAWANFVFATQYNQNCNEICAAAGGECHEEGDSKFSSQSWYNNFGWTNEHEPAKSQSEKEMLGVFKSKGFDCQAPGNNYHWSGSGFLYESRGRACYFPSPNGGYSCGHRQTNYRMMCWCSGGVFDPTTTTTTTVVVTTTTTTQPVCSPLKFSHYGIPGREDPYKGDPPRKFCIVETTLSNDLSNAVAACAALGLKPLANYPDSHDNDCGGLVEQLVAGANHDIVAANSDIEWPQNYETGGFIPANTVVVGNHGPDDATCGLHGNWGNRPFIGRCSPSGSEWAEWCQTDYCSTEKCNIVCAGPAVEVTTTTTTTTRLTCSLGPRNTNGDCPAGSTPIASAADCEACKDGLAGNDVDDYNVGYKPEDIWWASSGNWGGDVKGCYLNTQANSLYFNVATTGAPSPYMRPICGGGAIPPSEVTPAPTPAKVCRKSCHRGEYIKKKSCSRVEKCGGCCECTGECTPKSKPRRQKKCMDKCYMKKGDKSMKKHMCHKNKCGACPECTTPQTSDTCDGSCYTAKGALDQEKQCGKPKCAGCTECVNSFLEADADEDDADDDEEDDVEDDEDEDDEDLA